MIPAVDSFRALLASHPPYPGRYWIAYSGGLDSHVLLHLCAQARSQFPSIPEFRAIHIHHGLQPQANGWAEHCERTSRTLGIPFSLIAVDARAQAGESPEEAARRARYRAIRDQLSPGETVLTAQHVDDQAETLLLQLIRGAGLAGLAAMPRFARFAPGFLLRPLLGHTREELSRYASEHGLRWVDDPSNTDVGYDRNFMRHRVLPLLAQRWPSVSQSLARSAGHCAEALEQLENLSADLYQTALNGDGRSLSIARLKSYKPADQRLVLRHWLKTSGYRMPAAVVLERIRRELLPAAADRMPRVAWSEGEVRRYRDGLFVLPMLPSVDNSVSIAWDGASNLQLPGSNGELHVEPATPGLGIDAAAWHTGPIRVAFRQGGECCRLPHRAGSHSLKKLFQEAGIPPWLRERAPLVYIGDELAAIGEWWVTERFAASCGTPSVSLRWTRAPMAAAPSGGE